MTAWLLKFDMRVFKHFATITKHRILVMRNCFKVGLIWQGLTHDLSKYSPAEFIPGAKYYQGDKSPQVKEREIFGYSSAWLHHKGRNKHHFEYWEDVGPGGVTVYVEMPIKYFAEMICDRVAACKIYLKDKYDKSSALNYYLKRTTTSNMNEKTDQLLRFFLAMLAERGEKEMFAELKKLVKEDKKRTKNKSKS
jgi:hypothetical protein